MKLIFLIVDGTSIRNFIHSGLLANLSTDKYIIFSKKDLVPYLDSLGVKSIILPVYKSNFAIELLRPLISLCELYLNARKHQSTDYLLYIVKRPKLGFKGRIKELLIHVLRRFFDSQRGIVFLRQLMFKLIRLTKYYKECEAIISNYESALIFNTHQRAPDSIALLLAAKKWKQKSATFIYSWDNMPKGTLMAEADYYFVWSEYMKEEFSYYYPWLKPLKIYVSGTPQFLPYFDESFRLTRSEFALRYELDMTKEWICFSGDDETTSPFDDDYLVDLANVVTLLNTKLETKLQIILRPSPADFSNRYQQVVSRYSDIIKLIKPEWISVKTRSWSSLLPMRSDFEILVNLALHCKGVFNIGSTMAIDFSFFNKPSAYFAYNHYIVDYWDIDKVYKFIHFRTMGNINPVYWIQHSEQLESIVLKLITDVDHKGVFAKEWQQVVVSNPEKAIDNFKSAFTEIINS